METENRGLFKDGLFIRSTDCEAMKASVICKIPLKFLDQTKIVNLTKTMSKPSGFCIKGKTYLF